MYIYNIYNLHFCVNKEILNYFSYDSDNTEKSKNINSIFQNQAGKINLVEKIFSNTKYRGD